MTQLHIWVICKDGKMVKDFDFFGKELTTQINLAAQYTSRKAAVIAAQALGKQNGSGYTAKQWQ